MKGYKHLTAEQIAEILRVYDETWSVAETVRRLGWTAQRVRYALKRAGRPLSRSKGGACYQHKADVLRWAEEGVSFCEIGRRIGTTHHKVAAFLRKHGARYTRRPQRLENHPSWRGGRVVDQDGYVLLKRPDHPHRDRHGYVREHRLVMEAVLGRLLLPTEVVHHKDGNKENNDPANLTLFGKNADHLREELTGRVPEWTEAGLARMREGVLRSARARRKSSRGPSAPDAPPSP